MRKKLKLKGAKKEAPPAEETKPPKDDLAWKDESKATVNIAGQGGGEPDERGPDDKEPTLADDKRTGPVDPDTGEPRITKETAALVLSNPGAYPPVFVGAAIIKGLDRLALCMTAEVRTRQPELFQVFQLFAAERPSILERQKRLQLRQNQG